MSPAPAERLRRQVAVAIITYRRPDSLAEAVRGVLGQLEQLPMHGRVIVVDNDPEESARVVIDEIGSSSVAYVAEHEPGIPAARNAALDAADDSGLLAFIDDDETPQPGWLQTLIDTLERWDCDGVAGPTIRLLDGSESEWVRASGFFDPVSRPDGTELRGAPSGNLLLDLATVRDLGLRFDPRFAMTGGSDTLFTRQLTAGGGVIRWAEHAVTSEPVPPDRATREWVLARDRRIGNAWTRTHLVLADTRIELVRTVGWILWLATKLAMLSAARAAAGLVRDDLRHRARGERDRARARGLLIGLVGRRVEEYERR